MRSREIPPLKVPDPDHDLHRFTTTNHHYEPPINRKFSSCLNSSFLLFLIEVVFFLFLTRFIFSSHCTSGQRLQKSLYLNKRMILSTKRQIPAGSVEKIANFLSSFYYCLHLIITQLTGCKHLLFCFSL
jgi:hypothetical protein